MSLPEVELNRRVIRDHYEKLSRGDWKGAAQAYAPDARNFGREGGLERILGIGEDVRRAFPDWRTEIVDMVAERDTVVIRVTVSGTHRGVSRLPILGGLLAGVPPTERSFTVEQIHWYKMRSGQIIDHYATRDDLGMMKQLGLLAPNS